METTDFVSQEKKAINVASAIALLCKEYGLNEKEFKKMVEALSNMVNNQTAKNQE
ncbi:MAG: hypothetical protein K2H89_11190 [Oscillospiraceae bacterium]|nr:hypothetical protein [Oscillospiraceae bacterium]